MAPDIMIGDLGEEISHRFPLYPLTNRYMIHLVVYARETATNLANS